jgi:hypothetical protein
VEATARDVHSEKGVTKKGQKVKPTQCVLSPPSTPNRWRFRKVNTLKKRQRNAARLRRKTASSNTGTGMT